MLAHSVGALLACPRLEAVVVVLREGDEHASGEPVLGDPRVVMTRGGAQRSDSVAAGLAALAAKAAVDDWVLVHDAARPCVSQADLEKLMTRLAAHPSGGLLAEPVVDTVKEAGEDGLVCATLDRRRLWRAQTPQMFRLGLLDKALADARATGLAVTDEASAMEMAGHAVQLVPGSRRNLKITTPQDIALAEFYLGCDASGAAPSSHGA